MFLFTHISYFSLKFSTYDIINLVILIMFRHRLYIVYLQEITRLLMPYLILQLLDSLDSYLLATALSVTGLVFSYCNVRENYLSKVLAMEIKAGYSCSIFRKVFYHVFVICMIIIRLTSITTTCIEHLLCTSFC